MTKQFIAVDGIKIAYQEFNSATDQPTIFFIHGNSVSSSTWRKQLNDPGLGGYRLIAIDLPAHGDSAVAADPETAYSLPHLGSIMAKSVLHLANGQPFILAGVSLSTNIVAEMLAYNINPAGLVLAGPSLIGDNISVANIIKPCTSVGVVFTDEPDIADVKKYAAETSLSRDEDDLEQFMADFQIVKKPFRSALAASINAQNYSDELAMLRQINVPILIVFGADEKVIENDYLDDVPLPLWQNKIFKIPGASHLVHIDKPEIFNELLKSFALACFK